MGSLPAPSTGSGPIAGESAKIRPIFPIRAECYHRRYHRWQIPLNSLGNPQHVRALPGELFQSSKFPRVRFNREAEDSTPRLLSLVS